MRRWRNGANSFEPLQRVRPDFRKTVVYGVLAFAALIGGVEAGGARSSSLRERLIAYGCALLVAVFGILASRSAARETQRVTTARAGTAAATPLRLLVLLGGYLIAALAVGDLLGVGLQHLLLGGAVTGVILGLAAQPVLSNLFAGIVLLFARPYVPGTRIRVMSGAINGPLEGVIVSAGLLYTILETDDGPLNIPNNQLMIAAVGPAPEPAEPEAHADPLDGTVPDDATDAAVLGAASADAPPPASATAATAATATAAASDSSAPQDEPPAPDVSRPHSDAAATDKSRQHDEPGAAEKSRPHSDAAAAEKSDAAGAADGNKGGADRQ